MHAYNSKTGNKIIGTLERIPGTALISEDTFTQKPDGTVDFDYSGETDVNWDGQETIGRKRGNKVLIVFVDEDGDECLADELTLTEDDEDDEAE